MALTSSKRCSSLITMPIIDDDVVIMCPSDMIVRDNRGTKGVRLGQLVLGEPVSNYKPEKNFTVKDVRKILTEYIYKWMCLKAYGTEDSGEDDNPTIARSS